LCEFHTETFTFSFASATKVRALLLTGGICDRDVIVVCILPRMYIFMELETMSFGKLAAI